MFNLRLLHFAPALAVCALALPVRAQQSCTAADAPCDSGETRIIVTDSDSFGPAFSEWDSETAPNDAVPRLMIDKIDLGPNDRLIQADVTLTGSIFGTLRVHNRDPNNGCTGTMNIGVEPLQITSITPIAGLTFNPLVLGQSFNVNLAACTLGDCNNGPFTYAPPDGVTQNVIPIVGGECLRITSPAELAKFIAGAPGDKLEFSHSSNDSSGFQGCAPVSFLSDPFAQVSVTVRYVVCRLGSQDPCVERHRRMPASLLLYPEYDNRYGSHTLVTVTNTNCDQSQGPVDVEFVYVNKENCLENNFTVRLTPCDTYTVITRFQNPNSQRGYLYAFAKSTQTGQAISFNYLIGNLMAINGIYQFDWSVNPLVFKGVTGHRQPTDLDADGVRDLDGAEYWEAPDRLFVPRFLGQDDYNAPCAGGNCDFVPAGYASELVLLNLSGGAQFSTIAFFQIFNDNEEPFSASWEFQCWDRVRLNRINGAFTQSFLAGLKSNDPTEIIGATHHEAGWFWFDGVSGDSSAEHIENPAIYGFLIERVRSYFAADLPWEFCSQNNGDLLPHGPFGDPRPGFPGGQLGDNQ